MRQRARGFTLLEVLVAVAILGLGITAILSAQAGAFASAAHARNISVATGLLRCKMSEVEEHLYKEGFQDTDETGTGPCCEGDENPLFQCTWRADRPTFPEAKFGDLNLGAALDFSGGSSAGSSGGANPLSGAIGLLTGAGGPSPLAGASSISDVAKTFADANALAASPAAMPGAAGPSPLSSSSSGGTSTDSGAGAGAGGAMGGLASMAMSIVYPNLKLLFEASTRRITATVTFREGKKEHTIDVVEWFSVPQKGLTATDDSTAAASSTSTSPTTSPTSNRANTGKVGTKQ